MMFCILCGEWSSNPPSIPLRASCGNPPRLPQAPVPLVLCPCPACPEFGEGSLSRGLPCGFDVEGGSAHAGWGGA